MRGIERFAARSANVRCSFQLFRQNSQARAEGYIRLEWHLADQRTYLMGKSRPFLVPVCIDDTCVDADLPDSFSIVQWPRLPAGATSSAFVEAWRACLAQVYYGLFLSATGRSEEAAKQARLACELDPLSPITFGHASSTLCAIGHFDAAERMARHALDLQPDFVLGLVNCGLARCGLGRGPEAIEPLERAAVLSRAPVCLGWLGFGYAHGGRVEDARQLLRELDERGCRGEYIPAFASLTINVGLGDVAAIAKRLQKP
jgi:pentatricopeptide repeat protein